MRKPKALLAALSAALVGGVVAVATPAASAAPELSGKVTEFNVLTERGASISDAKRAITAAGGKVIRSNEAIGLLTATAPANGFAAALADSDAIFGATRARSIGHSPKLKGAAPRDLIERENELSPRSARTESARQQGSDGTDPLDEQLWGLKMVRSDLAREVTPGTKKVKVGVIDTGIDGSHPDIAPNFNRKLSRNFTVDIPSDPNGAEVDGPCEYRGCVDPADVDHGGHGTHVAGTIAAAANQFGISGVAPNVSLVNVRAGQDSGYFFLQPSVDALTYSADVGLDVVNMSFYIDPWLYNCQANPSDSTAEQEEQRTIVEAVNRAMNYAHSRGVTQIVALGNQHSDLGNPQPDNSSPDYPIDTAHPRAIDNESCLSLPTEGPNAIGVSALGPSKKKTDFSNYGTEMISVSAPGGYYRDYYGTPDFRTNENMILSAYPKFVGVAEGNIDDKGKVTPEGKKLGVQRAVTADGKVGYYQFLQGTSMAAPHASGVAALIVSQYGVDSRTGYGMDPQAVRQVLAGTAAKTPCPEPRTVDYLNEGRDATYTATCEGEASFNGFYGDGVVDAFAAVTKGGQYLG